MEVIVRQDTITLIAGIAIGGLIGLPMGMLIGWMLWSRDARPRQTLRRDRVVRHEHYLVDDSRRSQTGVQVIKPGAPVVRSRSQ